MNRQILAESTVGLAVRGFLLALPLFGVAVSIAKPTPDVSASISGTIVDNSGQPAKDATVFVYSARLKQGYAIVCPTCFVDCGKHAASDAQGQFTITGLNSTLKFRLLVVKDGFTATAKGGVDPAQGPLPPIKISPRAPSTGESKIVHGHVTNVSGNPVAGAVVEPVGAIESANLSSFGTMDWMDALAVTNAWLSPSTLSDSAEEVLLNSSQLPVAPSAVFSAELTALQPPPAATMATRAPATNAPGMHL